MLGRKLYSTPQTRPRRGQPPSAAQKLTHLFKKKSAAGRSMTDPMMVPTQHSEHHEEDFSGDSESAPEDTGRGKTRSNKPLTYADMSCFTADIKSTFSAAITDLKMNLVVLTEKLAATEHAGRQRDKKLHRLDKVTVSYAQHFIDMNRHLEDLDN